ncbi:MAG: (d)CMP kinase [Methylococcales bacterium]|nr:(d)CMP kinase [Methylococcales bacterium]
MTTAPVLTIDGPSGAGKGTVSRVLAARLGWHYLDSGAIYRALALAVRQAGIALDDVPAIVGVAEAMVLTFQCQPEYRVFLDAREITDTLPLEATGESASVIAAYPEVRQALLEKQRAFCQKPGLVADGRDMGTVVFTSATVKVFLTASAEQRALRRFKQLIEKGIDANLAKITEAIEARDLRDRSRSHAPLLAAEDAILIDSSALTIDQVVKRICAVLQEKL